MSQRKAIRHAFKALLCQIQLLDDRVHVSRAIPVVADADDGESPDVPCVLVYTDRDPAEEVDGYSQRRSLVLRVVCIVRSNVGADDELDEMCEAIERMVEAAFNNELDTEPAIIGLVESCSYEDTTLTYVGEEGRTALIHGAMQFTISYIRTPSQSFPQLKMIAVDVDMSNPRNDPQGEIKPDGQIDARVTVVFEHPPDPET